MSREPRDIIANASSDLRQRWQRARSAACRELGYGDEQAFTRELDTVTAEVFEELLRRVFLNSRNLGVSFQRRFSVVWELEDLIQFLPQLSSPCLQGDWRRNPLSAVLRRAGCDSGLRLGAKFCQYWREAIDGLVMGLCESEHFTRHACRGNGDADCQDVFFIERADTVKSRWRNPDRWGVVPPERGPDLEAVTEKLLRMNVDVTFLGLKENKLHYKMESKSSHSCGSAGGILRGHLEKLVHEAWPGVILVDASPLAVYGEQA